jgi:hypothetical protein
MRGRIAPNRPAYQPQGRPGRFVNVGNARRKVRRVRRLSFLKHYLLKGTRPICAGHFISLRLKLVHHKLISILATMSNLPSEPEFEQVSYKAIRFAQPS